MKTIREEMLGRATLRLLQTNDGFAGIAIRDGTAGAPIRGDDAGLVWAELRQAAMRTEPSYFGYDGARSRFLRMFPEGFAGRQFQDSERGYKVAASEFLRGTVSIEAAENADAETCTAAAKAYSKTNMLSQFEHARVRDVLRGPEGPTFLRGAAALARGDVSGGLLDMERAFRSYGQPSWPAATYLPFLWEPGRHMFLKPQVTIDFAERVGHDFARTYSPRFHATTYDCLLDLADQTSREIASLSPRDRIDLQSFIWVVGAYTDDDADAQRQTN